MNANPEIIDLTPDPEGNGYSYTPPLDLPEVIDPAANNNDNYDGKQNGPEFANNNENYDPQMSIELDWEAVNKTGLFGKGKEAAINATAWVAKKQRENLENSGQGQQLIDLVENQMTDDELISYLGLVNAMIQKGKAAMDISAKYRKKLMRAILPKNWLKLKHWEYETVVQYIALGVLQIKPEIAKLAEGTTVKILSHISAAAKYAPYVFGPEVAPVSTTVSKVAGGAATVGKLASPALPIVRAQVAKDIAEREQAQHEVEVTAQQFEKAEMGVLEDGTKPPAGK